MTLANTNNTPDTPRGSPEQQTRVRQQLDSLKNLVAQRTPEALGRVADQLVDTAVNNPERLSSENVRTFVQSLNDGERTALFNFLASGNEQQRGLRSRLDALRTEVSGTPAIPGAPSPFGNTVNTAIEGALQRLGIARITDMIRSNPTLAPAAPFIQQAMPQAINIVKTLVTNRIASAMENVARMAGAQGKSIMINAATLRLTGESEAAATLTAYTQALNGARGTLPTLPEFLAGNQAPAATPAPSNAPNTPVAAEFLAIDSTSEKKITIDGKEIAFAKAGDNNFTVRYDNNNSTTRKFEANDPTDKVKSVKVKAPAGTTAGQLEVVIDKNGTESIHKLDPAVLRTALAATPIPPSIDFTNSAGTAVPIKLKTI